MGAVSTADAYYKRATLLQSALTLPVSPAVSGKNSSGGGDTAAAQVRETLLLTKGLLCFTKSQVSNNFIYHRINLN